MDNEKKTLNTLKYSARYKNVNASMLSHQDPNDLGRESLRKFEKI